MDLKQHNWCEICKRAYWKNVYKEPWKELPWEVQLCTTHDVYIDEQSSIIEWEKIHQCLAHYLKPHIQIEAPRANHHEYGEHVVWLMDEKTYKKYACSFSLTQLVCYFSVGGWKSVFLRILDELASVCPEFLEPAAIEWKKVPDWKKVCERTKGRTYV